MLQVMVVADSETHMQRLSQSVVSSGYALADCALSSGDWSGLVREIEPDVLLVNARFLDRKLVGQVARISEERALPVAMFTDNSDRGLMVDSLKAGVTAYVVKGMDTSRVPAVLDLAVARFKELQVLRGELAEARSDLATRKLVERAKGIVMEQRQCTEDEAHRMLQKTAMDHKKRLVEVAREVILIAELLTTA
ncbi:MAG: ANTAR domain-containing protein [Marinobacter nauticus]|nr:ANTAR domain-containing protein [Marinobacter nauticus]